MHIWILFEEKGSENWERCDGRTLKFFGVRKLKSNQLISPINFLQKFEFEFLEEEEELGWDGELEKCWNPILEKCDNNKGLISGVDWILTQVNLFCITWSQPYL